MTRRYHTKRNALLLLIANGLGSILGLIRSFYILRVLLPSSYGIWSLVSTLLGYANYADMGVNTGFILEVPKLIGQGLLDEAQRVQRQAFTAILGICSVLFCGLVLVTFLPIHFGVTRVTLLIVAVSIMVTAFLNYYSVVARIQDNYWLIGLSTLVMASVSTVGIILVSSLSHDLRVESVALISVLGSMMAVLLLGRAMHVHPAWPPNWSDWLRLAKLGLPVSLVPIAFTLFQSVDRWVVAALVPTSTMGYYGLGTTLGLFLYMIPNTLATVLFTRQIEHMGATGNPRSSEPLVLPPLQMSGYIMALVSGGAVLSIPFFIRYVAPNYLPGTSAAIFQVIGNCFLFAVPISTQILASVNKIMLVFCTLFIGLLLEVGLVALLVRSTLGIDGAALAVMFSDAIYSIVITYLVMRLFDATIRGQLGRVLSCFLPFAISLPLAIFLLAQTPMTGVLWNDTIRLGMAGTTYVLISTLLLVLCMRVTGLIIPDYVKGSIGEWLPARLATLLNLKEKP